MDKTNVLKMEKKIIKREPAVRVCSVDEDFYTCTQEQIDKKVRRNALGQIVRVKQRPVVDDNDPDGGDYSLAVIEAEEEGGSHSLENTSSVGQSKVARLLRWRPSHRQIIDVIVGSFILTVLAVLFSLVINESLGNYDESLTLILIVNFRC